MMMNHHVHTNTQTHTYRTTDRTTNLLISSIVHYVHLGGDNDNSKGWTTVCGQVFNLVI